MHATLGASKYSWIRYSDEQFLQFVENQKATLLGTKKHELAALHIELGERMPKSKKTLCSYVNDAIGYKMTPEQVLYYSPNCFGTADAISFRDGMLRIHDLKTGRTPAKFDQLIIYAALFCLEYGYKPKDISMELRIYQNNEILIHEATADEVEPVMAKIKRFDKLLQSIDMEE